MEDEAITPKRYIRTLAGDMEVLKSGGTPDLAPLGESKPKAAERLVAASPVAPMPAPIPLPAPTPVPEPAPPAPNPTEPTSIETYASDFSDKVKEEHASPVTVLAAEQDAATEKPPAPPVRHPRSGIWYAIAGVALLVAGGTGIYIAYTRYATSLAPVMLAPTVSAPIFVDDREQISGVGPVLLQAIEQSAASPLAPDTVRLLYTASATTTDNSIFSAIQVPAPDILLRNIHAEGSMAGIINAGGVRSPFFILSVASYGDTFSGMLSWEPLMPRDLAPLFPPYPTTASSTAATSTPAVAFRDEVVNNHDVRMYNDAAGRSILLYGYWNQTTLVIARDSASFTELLNRLSNSQAQR